MRVSGERLVITGASGQLGRLVAECALERCEPDRLILVTRRPEVLADLSARGPTVRFADFAEPRRLRDAFAGGERMLLISATDLAHRTEQHRAAIDAAAAAGVAHVIYTSMIAPEPPNPAVIAPSHYATEQWLAQSRLSWTVLRHSLYADYQVPEAARAIATGGLLHNRGDGRIAYVAREDCAAVAAAVLTSAGHEGAVHEVTGPESYDGPALASVYAEVGGRPVIASAIGDGELIGALVGSDAADDHARYGAELVTSIGRAIREGYFARCTDTVATLTGRPARTLRQVLEAGSRSSAL